MNNSEITSDQVKAFMASVLKTLSEEFEQDALNETQSPVSSALHGVSHRLGSAIDDLGWHMDAVLEGDAR